MRMPKKVSYSVGECLSKDGNLVWVIAKTEFTATLATNDEVGGKKIYRTRGTYTQEELDILGFRPSYQFPLPHPYDKRDQILDPHRYFKQYFGNMREQVFNPGKVSESISREDLVWIPSDENQRVYYINPIPIGPIKIIGCLWKEISPENRKIMFKLGLVFETPEEAKEAYKKLTT